MPIYEYQCESCGHRKDALQRMSDDPLVDCPACGQPTLRKLVSAPRFRLKGSGWYETDFKTDNRRNLAEGGDGAGKASDGDKSKSADAGTKSEPAKKADTASTSGGKTGGGSKDSGSTSSSAA